MFYTHTEQMAKVEFL